MPVLADGGMQARKTGCAGALPDFAAARSGLRSLQEPEGSVPLL